jgi:hypothetical protein
MALSQHHLFPTLHEIHDIFIGTQSLHPQKPQPQSDTTTHFSDPAVPLINFRIPLSKWLTNHHIDIDLRSIDEELKMRLYSLYADYLTVLNRLDRQFLGNL